MKKRVLSWVLACALLVGCLGGLSLVAGAADGDAAATYAKIDFSTGQIVGTNANVTYNHTSAQASKTGDAAASSDQQYFTQWGVDVQTNGLAKIPGTEDYGMFMYRQNNGFGISVSDIGLTGQDVAISVEYYFPGACVQNATRFGMVFNDTTYQMSAGGDSSHVNASALVLDEEGLVTYTVTGTAAEYFKGGGTINTYCWNYNNNPPEGDQNGENPGNDYYYIKSITIFPASELGTIDTSYDHYDFVNKVSLNPYYPQYKEADAYGMKWSLNGTEGAGSLTANGLEMTSGCFYFDVTLARQQTVVFVRMKFAPGTEGKFTFQYNYDESDSTYTGNANYYGTSLTMASNGVCTVLLTNANFNGQQNAGCSFRMYSGGRTLERIEVYTVNVESLQKLIANLKAMDVSDKTARSVAALNTALDEAAAVAANAGATDEDIQNAFTALGAAEAMLQSYIPIAGDGSDTEILAPQYAAMYDVEILPSNPLHIEDANQDFGNIGAGDYVEYDVVVEKAGIYAVSFSIATPSDNNKVSLHYPDTNAVMGTATAQNTSAWQTYSYDGNAIEGGVYLSKGEQTLRIYFDNGGINFQKAKFTWTGMSKQVDLMDPSWNNGSDTAPLIVEESGTRYMNMTQGRAFSYNNDSIGKLFGLNENTVVDLQITLDYEKTSGQDQNCNWWRFKTMDAATKAYTADDGYCQIADIGFTVSGSRAVGTETRNDQLLYPVGSSSGTDEWYLGTEGVDSNASFRIYGIRYSATTKDGITITGVWGTGATMTGAPTNITGYSLTLREDIGLNYHITAETGFDTTNVSARVTLPDGTTETQTPVVDGTAVTVTANVPAKEMTDNITVVLVDASGNQSLPYIYSVARYAEAMLDLAETATDAEYVKAAPLVRAMLNYGANAQQYFDHNTANLANESLSATDKDVSSVTADTLAPYRNTDAQKAADGSVRLSAANLSLLSKTTLRLFFTLGEGQSIDSFAFTYSGQALTPTAYGNYYYVEVTGINPQELAQEFAVTVTKDGGAALTATYSPMAYAAIVLSNGTYPETLNNTLRAFYLYNQAAVVYTAA